MDQSAALSQSDIEDLMNNRTSSAAQLSIVNKLTGQYNTEGGDAMNANEAELANGIFGLLMKNAETQVRAVMAENLRKSNKLPLELVRQMASDVSEVAAPILEQSPLMTDEMLMRIISAEADTKKLEAIARRETITEAVSDALVETRVESVVRTVVLNEGAKISENTFDKIAERHSDSVAVMESLFERSSVPPAIVAKVIDKISDTMRGQLEEKFGNLMDHHELQKMFEQSLELTSLKMLGFHSDDKELLKVLDHLDGSNKLTPFSALSMANLQLFEVSLSRMLKIPLKNVQVLIQDSNGLKRAYFAADLPEFLYEATDLSIRALRAIDEESVKRTGFKEVISPFQLMQQMQNMAGGDEVEGVEYLYALMQQSTRKQVNSGLH